MNFCNLPIPSIRIGNAKTRSARRTKATAFLFPLIFLGIALTGCEQERASTKEQRPQIVASIFPLGNLAEQVAGDAAEARTLLNPGQSEHGFELSASQVAELAEADILIIAGRGLDNWLAERAKAAGGNPIVLSFAAMVGMETGHTHAHEDPLEHEHHHDAIGPNPHLWLDPVLAVQFVMALEERFTAVIPEYRDELHQRSERLIRELKELDDEYRRQIESLSDEQRHIVTFHNAFDPLAERYGLTVAAHLVIVEGTIGAEVTPQRLTEAIEAVKRWHLPSVYAEPQLPDRAATLLSQQTDARVRILDPLGDPSMPGYDSYQNMMRSNLHTLIRGQKGLADE